MIHSKRKATRGDAVALNIRNTQAEQLAAEVARLQRRTAGGRSLGNELDEIALHCSRLPVLDSRSPDAILGYDDHGLPR
jgi:antitoxin VapB